MAKMRIPVLRGIAQDQLLQLVGESVDDQQLQELVTSVVRQWLTYEDKAGLLFDNGSFCLTLLRKGEAGYEVGVSRGQGQGNILRPLLHSRKIEIEDMPATLHRLNISQSVEVENVEGKKFRLSFNPKDHSVSIGEVEELDL